MGKTIMTFMLTSFSLGPSGLPLNSLVVARQNISTRSCATSASRYNRHSSSQRALCPVKAWCATVYMKGKAGRARVRLCDYALHQFNKQLAAFVNDRRSAVNQRSTTPALNTPLGELRMGITSEPHRIVSIS